jgi:hypothetical protein
LQIWWPDTADKIAEALKDFPVVILWQCPAELSSLPVVVRNTCWQRPFQTPLIDLATPAGELWNKCDPKSCRYEIRKAGKLEHVILRNSDQADARNLINESIHRLRYRREIGRDEWDGLLEEHDVYLCKSAGKSIAAHVLMKDCGQRAKLLLSATVDRNVESTRKLVGPLNRLMHWTEILDYKAEGFSTYDFGGCSLDPTSSDYPIGQFKLSFGASISSEPIVYLSADPLIRARLKAMAILRACAKLCPVPDRVTAFVRQRPWLANRLR